MGHFVKDLCYFSENKGTGNALPSVGQIFHVRDRSGPQARRPAGLWPTKAAEPRRLRPEKKPKKRILCSPKRRRGFSRLPAGSPCPSLWSEPGLLRRAAARRETARAAAWAFSSTLGNRKIAHGIFEKVAHVTGDMTEQTEI